MLIRDIYDRLALNDDKIYEEIFVLYYRHLVRIATGILWDLTEAEDIVQTAMLKFHHTVRKGQLQRDAGPVFPFLRTIVRNEALTRLHYLNAWHRRLFTFCKTFADRATPFDLASASEEEKVLLNEIGKLSPRQRQCCYLYFVEDESYDSIAQLLGISQTDVRKHILRGRKRLISAINRNHQDTDQ